MSTDYGQDLVQAGVPEAVMLSNMLKLEVRLNSAITREQLRTQEESMNKTAKRKLQVCVGVTRRKQKGDRKIESSWALFVNAALDGKICSPGHLA